MKCMNCGAELTESVYCPKCGCDVSVQKQACVLSGLYYNQGLEKAQVRDLSGAIDQLKRSLKFNKLNIPARNLLGLVYFETGEVVAALSEWVISKNIQPEDNIAADYIRNLQQDANRLDVINQTIKKYNLALKNCFEGNEDVSLIQLKKILAQNPKLIKGYHLLALLYLNQGEYEKARKLLKKAIRIDKTNTTTLRFLREVDEQTGTETHLETHFSLWNRKNEEEPQPTASSLEVDDREDAIQPIVARGGQARMSIVNMLIGMAVGAAAIWFLFIPAWTRSINRTANEKVTKYSSDMAVYSAQIQMMNDQIEVSQKTVTDANDEAETALLLASSYQNMVKAMNAWENGQTSTAATYLAGVEPSLLDGDTKGIFNDMAEEMDVSLFAAYKKAGIAAFDSKNYKEAVRILELAKTMDPTDYDILNYLAHSYRMQGNAEQADLNFNLIISSFPDSQKAANARQYLSTNSAEIEAQAVAEKTADTQEEDEGEEEQGGEDE